MSTEAEATAETPAVDPAPKATAAPKKAPVSVESVAHSALDLAERASEKANRAMEKAEKSASFFASKATAAPAAILPPEVVPPPEYDGGDFLDRAITSLTGLRRDE